MRKNWLLLILATILVTVQMDATAQQQQKEKYRNKANDPASQLPYYKKLRWADGLFRAGSHFNAIEYYSQLLQEQPRNPYLHYQLAECYLMTRDYVPASDHYASAYAIASKIYPEAIYKEAIMLKMQARYEESILKFKKFIADNPKTYKKLKKRAQREIAGCIMGMNSVKDPIAVNIVNAGPNVNSAYTESAPYPLGDTALLFSTMNQNVVVEVDKRKRAEYMSRFMVSHKQYHVDQVDSFQWPLRFMDGNFNNPKVHVGNGSFSPGGDRFYFTRCAEEDSFKVVCKIYVSKFEGAKWSEPTMLGEGINEEGSNTQPFVAKIGKKEILFFSSNRKLQGRGGYDIWYSIIDPRNGTYRRPQNAGKSVNTEMDEETPYYDSRVNKLYFSSNGWETMGGFDVYSADGGPSRYTNLRNLGYPINTSADELYYIKDNYGKPDAYVVSNRIGSIALKNPTCCDDIWRIQYEPTLMVTGKVVNHATGAMITESVVKMVDEKGTEKTYNSADGNFNFNLQRLHSYVFTADKAHYTTERFTISTLEIKRTDPDDTQSITIYMDTIGLANFQVSNIYYDFAKATLRPESVASLDTLVNYMKDNSFISVDIFAFTDQIGSVEKNMKLSQDRAQSVLNYLEQHGIETTRMIAKGMGPTRPVGKEKDKNGHDQPGIRQLDRRTELRITVDDPKKHIIYNSAKPGSMYEQAKNLQAGAPDDDDTPDPESEVGRPGSRVNKDQNP